MHKHLFRYTCLCTLVSLLIIFPARAQTGANVEKVAGADWIHLSKPDIVKLSEEVLAMPDIPVRSTEVVHRIEALGLQWDIAASVHEPEDPARIPVGPDGKKIGLFILHGGGGHHPGKNEFARFLATKFGYKVVNMSYPGNYNLQDPSGNWSGETMHPDGSVRTPVYLKDELITKDQYEVVTDTEDSRRRRWGTLYLACAKEGSNFYDRLAGWPRAHEAGATELARRYLPEGEFSIYSHGHSTGGPMTMMLTQRIPNIVGVLGLESSPFGALYGKMTREQQGIDVPWAADFNCLRIRSWRDIARYYGYELIEEEGVDALARLAMVIEEVMEKTERGLSSALFKAENILHFDSPEQMEAAARASAKRLNMGKEETEELVDRYLGYLRGVSGPGVKPVPPLLLIIASNSRDHDARAYREVYLPGYAAMKPAPRVKLYEFATGKHGYSAPEEGLPMGIAPGAMKLWNETIMSGYYLQK